MNGVIYMYTSPSGKSYIGQTNNYKKRKTQHANISRSKTIFSKAIKKYGIENMKYQILHENIQTREKLNELEAMEIKKRNTIYPNGYNMMHGGKGFKGCDWNVNQIFLIPWKNKGKKMSKEAKAKIGIGNTGKTRSKENKKKISNSLKSYFKKNKHALFMLKYNTIEFYRKNPKAKELAREKALKQFSDIKQIQIQKDIKRHLMKKVKCITTNIIYESLHDAEKQTGCFRQNIKKCCDGKSKATKGFEWMWMHENT